MAPDKLSALAESASLLHNEGSCPSSVSCSVCLEIVNDLGERSIAKLKCGHRFHLDCIGSAFNAKGRMQCPNCRQVEHGQWLYANACYMHEELVQELTNDDDYEAYDEMPDLVNLYNEMQSGHMPWCPYQGSYPHFAALEEIHTSVNGYPDITMSMRPGPRASITGLVCPYLAAEGLRMEGYSQLENLLNLQIGHALQSNNNRRTTAFSSVERNSWAHQLFIPSDSNSILTLHAGGLQNPPSRERIRPIQRNTTPRGAEAFYLNSQFLHPGFQRTNQGGSFTSEPSGTLHSQNHGYGMPGQYQPTSADSAAHNGYLWNRRPTYRDLGLVPSQRVMGISYSEQPWVPAHRSRRSIDTVGPNFSFGNGLSWGAEGLVDSWTRGVAFSSQGLYGTPHHWWAWDPPGGIANQNVTSNSFPNSYYEGQGYGGNSSLLRPNSPSQRYFGHPDGSGFLWPSMGFH